MNIWPAVTRLTAGIGLVCAFGGCAGVTHRSMGEADDAKENGIRYYESAPYLLIHSDGKGGLVWQIIYLPDQTRKMVAKPFNFFAKLDSTLSFTNGVLTSAKDVATADAVPKAIVEAIQKVAPLLLGAARADGIEPEVPAPHLYKIVVHGQSQVEFFGGPGDTPIKVTLRNEGGK